MEARSSRPRGPRREASTRRTHAMKTIIKNDEAAVSPVIATILMVAITVVLAAVLYVMVSGLITPVGGNKPLVTFSAVTQSSGNATIAVAGASQSVSPSNYKVNLQVGRHTDDGWTVRDDDHQLGGLPDLLDRHRRREDREPR